MLARELSWQFCLVWTPGDMLSQPLEHILWFFQDRETSQQPHPTAERSLRPCPARKPGPRRQEAAEHMLQPAGWRKQATCLSKSGHSFQGLTRGPGQRCQAAAEHIPSLAQAGIRTANGVLCRRKENPVIYNMDELQQHQAK